MNYDDDSDLTDIESGDEYEVKKKANNSSAGVTNTKSTYRIRNALKVPRATTYTAQALYDQIHNDDINLDPEYQRGVVWPDTKQIGIIDSIFRNFYIPPVIFAANVAEDGSETKTCIDGKQRLTSIHRFMDGLIPHKDPITSEKWWYKDVATSAKKVRKILPEKLRKSFANKQIVCVEYQEITDNDEREIFQRVQLGMALTPAEKLQVINTCRSSFVRGLQSEHLKDGGLATDSLEWDSSRGSDFRCVAQALWCIDKHNTSELKNSGTVLQLEKWLSSEEDLSASFRAKGSDTFRIFSALVQDSKHGWCFKKPGKVSPIEFVMITLLIAVHKDKLSMAQLSDAIGQMREEVRKAHVDIRMNNRVAKTMIDFINNLKPVKIPGDMGGVAGSSSNGNAAEKRKRSSDDDEEPAQPKSKKAVASSSSAQVKVEKSTPPISKPSRNTISTQKVAKPSAVAIDRMAAVRAAKNSIAQNQSSRLPPAPQHIPLGPRADTSVRTPYYPSAPTPQMLPSPGQSFSFPSALAASSNAAQFHSFQQGMVQSQSPANLLDASLMGVALHTNNREGGRASGSWSSAPSRPEQVGPPPLSAGTIASGGVSRYSERPYIDRPYPADDGDYLGDRDGRYPYSRGRSPDRRNGSERYRRTSDTGWGSRR